ncbi:hypothetical protein FHX78_115541 [Streptomyces capillispiralis]|uniref:Uncharacterized protein n=1 Tax=Streptomyces capillispiralis TaxID=68182 RepID=A0A561TMY5_9ACTN|nr:hypothetical protein FHX78_115541 [Streptomyces capillispiralis]
MAALRECSGCAQVATARGMTHDRIRPSVAADVPAARATVDAVERRVTGPHDRPHHRERPR